MPAHPVENGDDIGVVLPRGQNQSGVRAHNETLVLKQLRLHGALSKAELARRTGLSAQAISVINRNLERDGLVIRGEPQRGRIGQPSIPMRLNADGAFGVGLRIGRRSTDLTLVDLSGEIRAQIKTMHRNPLPDATLRFVRENVSDLFRLGNVEERDRICGLGIGAPYQLWNWLDRLDAPSDGMAAWETFDLASEVSDLTQLPVLQENDASAACIAELVCGTGARYNDFGYFYIASFIGGGVVLDRAPYRGPSGNAGAFGSIPAPSDSHDTETQLIDRASVYLLERAMLANGLDTAILRQPGAEWAGFEDVLDVWIETAALAIARSILAVVAVLDLPTIVIDGALPEAVKIRLCGSVEQALLSQNTQGLVLPNVVAGEVGFNARAVGSAILPINHRYFAEKAQDVRIAH